MKLPKQNFAKVSGICLREKILYLIVFHPNEKTDVVIGKYLFFTFCFSKVQYGCI